MKANTWRGMVATVLGAAAIAVAAGAPEVGYAGTWQAPKVQYSADSHTETSEGVVDGTVHVAPGMERREFIQDGEKQVLIMRRDKKVMWMLMPEDQTYLEMALGQDGGRKDDMSAYKVTQTKVGSETVNGIKTTKSKIIMIGPKGDKLGGFYWTSKEGIVVKIDAIAVDKGSKERFKMELTNLKVGNVDPAAFEVPAGYSKMDMSMGGMGKQLMGGGDGKPPAPEKQPQQPASKPGFSLKNALDLLK